MAIRIWSSLQRKIIILNRIPVHSFLALTVEDHLGRDFGHTCWPHSGVSTGHLLIAWEVGLLSRRKHVFWGCIGCCRPGSALKAATLPLITMQAA